MNRFYTTLRAIAYWPMKLLFQAKVIGYENMPVPQKVITVSNHLSMIDIILVGVNVYGYRHFVAKKELEKVGFMRWLMKNADAITIDRGKADLSAIKKILTVLRKGEGLSIFPEGTRNKDDETLQEVKTGSAMFALKGNAPIVPVMIHHKQKLFCRNYVYIAPMFTLDEFAQGKVDNATIEKAAEKIEQEMKKAQDYLNDYVANKRWKEEKRKIKQDKKAYKLRLKELKQTIKAQIKAEKKAKKQLKKSKENNQ